MPDTSSLPKKSRQEARSGRSLCFPSIEIQSRRRRRRLHGPAEQEARLTLGPTPELDAEIPDEPATSSSSPPSHPDETVEEAAVSPLFRLPIELRLAIYEYALIAEGPIILRQDSPEPHQPPLLSTSRKIREEAIGVFYGRSNRFILKPCDWAGIQARHMFALVDEHGKHHDNVTVEPPALKVDFDPQGLPELRCWLKDYFLGRAYPLTYDDSGDGLKANRELRFASQVFPGVKGRGFLLELSGDQNRVFA